jgi:DMSO reductase anchor subunit
MAQTDNPFTILNILWLAMMGGVVLITLVFYFVIGDSLYDSSLTGFLEYLALVVVLAAGLGSPRVYQLLMQRSADENSLEAKIAHYRTAKIVQVALLEGSATFCVVVASITGFLWLYLLLLLVLVSMVMYRPGKQQFAADASLTREQAAALEKY